MGDQDAEIEKRRAHNPTVKRIIVQELQTFLHQNNNLVKMFKMALNRMPSDSHNIVIRADKTPAGAETNKKVSAMNFYSCKLMIRECEFALCVDGKCSKRYSRDLIADTITGNDGCPLYRRRSVADGGRSVVVKVKGQDFEVVNRWIGRTHPYCQKHLKFISK
ncbi:hypothetical protein EVAR_48280_1 [Eumeta japonica]|uniref:Uncharacterized protein n=1 Tax=Eumeta variegata TaxID=151549 RepID=A0A4C1WNF7_EUMVA|nr:hypothetical protein EVAR_48280_1 [Eumeta japonica]